MLEASTGRVVHTLPGLGQVHGDDLDGDGLVDLWGEHEGDLRLPGRGARGVASLEMLTRPAPPIWRRGASSIRPPTSTATASATS